MTQKKPKVPQVPLLPFDRDNWLIIGIGLIVIAVGYLFLRIPPVDSFWSLTVAPILLVGGYCVILPVAILKRKKQ